MILHLYAAAVAQESAVGSLKSLDSLLSWVQKRKGGKEVVRQALEALKELFLKVREGGGGGQDKAQSNSTAPMS
jgi:hypothetical protein